MDLLEQCTRFHIMVEHRCCELGVRNLPPDDAKFDSRMNMQMYTQALAGLQQLYENLRHHGVPCPNEVEFQAYDLPISPHISPYLVPRSRRRSLVSQLALERTRTPPCSLYSPPSSSRVL